MSISSGPAQGYLDYQRTVNLDGLTQYQNANLSIPAGGQQVLGPFDFSRYGYLAGFIIPVGGLDGINVTISWWLDQAASIKVSQITFPLAHLQEVWPHVACRGPFVTVTLADVGGLGASVGITIYPTNRPVSYSNAGPIATNQPINWSDAGVVDQLGQQYVVASVPSTAKGDHPPNELQLVSLLLAASATVVTAPGAGKRIRVFAMQVAPNATSIAGYLQDAGTGQGLLWGSQINGATITLPAQGYPLTTNAELHYILAGGSGNMFVAAWYTIETV